MESGNSGSMAQSSSDGEEEYDSSPCGARVKHQHSYPRDSHVTLQHSPFSATAPPPPYFDPLASPYSAFLNPNPSAPNTSNFPPARGSMSSTSDQVNQNTRTVGVRNPRKRTRASRRAPTTVLTTDTTNFRAMVQEFTGIPASPFAAASSSASSLLFPGARARLGQLFGANRSFLPDLPVQHRLPYLQRSANQIQPPSTAPPLTTTTVTTTTTANDVINNYTFPLSDLGLIHSPLNWADGEGPSRSAVNGGNCNLNSTAAARCEGMLESWICSTDL